MKGLGRNEVLLSVCMLTYNHEKWISQAIEGVLKQKTTFVFELIIGEDCSTDGTKEIVKTYSANNNSIIKATYNHSNLGLAKNFSQSLNKCEGKYIAICEGDDFWTDPNKLQKQVEFLETNPKCILISHNSLRLNESTGKIDNSFKYYQSFNFDQLRFLEDWVTQPLTCVFRNIFRDYTLLNKEGNIFCDVILFYELLKHGDGYFLADNMATFRVHQNAISSGLSTWDWFWNHVIMFDFLYKYNKRDKLLQKKSRKYCLSLYIYNLKNNGNERHEFKPLKEYFIRNPGFLEGAITVILRVPYYILKYGIFSRIKFSFKL